MAAERAWRVWISGFYGGSTSATRRVQAVTVRGRRTGEETVIRTPYVLDATELGDVLPMAGAEQENH